MSDQIPVCTIAGSMYCGTQAEADAARIPIGVGVSGVCRDKPYSGRLKSSYVCLDELAYCVEIGDGTTIAVVPGLGDTIRPRET